jgi:hypothetical protein
MLGMQQHALISNLFAYSVAGPEKAGVGGSIPSLATIFRIKHGSTPLMGTLLLRGRHRRT